MSFRTKINPANDFEMNIVDYPPTMEDFNSLRFPNISHVWVENPNQQLGLFANQYLENFNDVQSFVKSQISSGRISIIQVDPSFNQPSNGYRNHYVCFWGNPYSLEDDTISFRIDQHWSAFQFPQKLNGVAAYIKTIAPGLSGAIIGPLEYPEIMLSQDWIGNPKVCYGYDGKGNIVNSESIQKAMRDYFLLAQDYWGVATILDKLGFIWLWNIRNQREFEIRTTGLNFKEWFQAELQNPFRQHPEPEWVHKKNA